MLVEDINRQGHVECNISPFTLEPIGSNNYRIKLLKNQVKPPNLIAYINEKNDEINLIASNMKEDGY